MTILIRIVKLTLLLLLIPALAWGLMGRECFRAFDGIEQPTYYWQVIGTVYIVLPSRKEARTLIPDMEMLGYHECTVTNWSDYGGQERYALVCRWCQGEELE
ncbi:MAG: hypothetical protein KJ604_20045 [Gammaproteobacteria bacterium]|nr:hypothetical protein [Gammaproteobacteria bacterium]